VELVDEIQGDAVQIAQGLADHRCVGDLQETQVGLLSQVTSIFSAAEPAQEETDERRAILRTLRARRIDGLLSRHIAIVDRSHRHREGVSGGMKVGQQRPRPGVFSNQSKIGAATLLLTAWLAGPVPGFGRPAAVQPRIEFNLPAQPLGDALFQFAAQSRLQIMFADEITEGLQAPRITGQYTPEDALKLLLAGSNLRYRYPNPRTVVVAVPWFSRLRSGKTTVVVSPSSPDGAVEEVIITASRIRDAGRPASTVLTLTRRDIEKTGFTTLPQVLRALPPMFNGGPSEDTRLGNEALHNSSSAIGINLRGLGAGSTLVLVDGRRLAAGAAEGRFVDVSPIPISAIERIEIVLDGISAVYGSDAVGGVVNFITRKDYTGAQTSLTVGTVTEGTTRERQASQLLGDQWEDGGVFLAAEYYWRDRLRATDRAQTANSDLRPFGGSNFNITDGSNPGTLVVGTQSWALPAGQDGAAIDPATLVAGTFNSDNRNRGRDVLPETRRWSALGRAHQQFGERVHGSIDVLYAQRDTRTHSRNVDEELTVTDSNPFYVNPTGGTDPVAVFYNFTDDLGPLFSVATVDTLSATASADVKLGPNWRMRASLGYASEGEENVQRNRINPAALDVALRDPNPLTALNPFGDGSHTNPQTLAAIARDEVRVKRETAARVAQVIADGSLFSLGGRQVKLAVGAEYRRETLDSFSRLGARVLVDRELDRDVAAIFAELLVPLFPRLDLSLAGRHERFSDFGTARIPRIGLRWQALPGIALRGSWGRSFKAPNLVDLDESANFSAVEPLPDTGVPAGSSTALLWGGSNADLEDEHAETWSAGLEWSGPTESGLTMGVSYFSTSFANRIAEVPLALPVDARIEPFVNRAPTLAQRERVCFHSEFLGSPDDCLSAPIDMIVDLRTNNVAITRTSGADVEVAYRVNTGVGTLDFGLNTTRLFRFEQAALRTLPAIDLLDTASNPQKFRVRASTGWARGAFGMHAAINYAGAYRDTVSVPARRIGSWTTIDLHMSAELMRDSELALDIYNAFDEMPPFYNNASGVAYDRENADVLGRFASLTVRKRW
jgi:iron complex outermembrane receptor protein